METKQNPLDSMTGTVTVNGHKFDEVVKFRVGGHLAQVTYMIDGTTVGQSWMDLDENRQTVYTTISGMDYDEYYAMQW